MPLFLYSPLSSIAHLRSEWTTNVLPPEGDSTRVVRSLMLLWTVNTTRDAVKELGQGRFETA
jgi:hypothetical protein